MLIFARAPRRGQVKTRLAAQIGARRALAVYRVMLETTLRTNWSGAPGARVRGRKTGERRGHARVTVLVEPPRAVRGVRRSVGRETGLVVLAQEGANLGERLAAGFREAFGHGARRVVAIGADSPDLPPTRVRAALRALAGADAVIGPAADGGYYLIGLARMIEEAFRGIPWSTRAVAARTLAALRRAGATVRMLERWWDIDTVEDVRALIARSRRTRLGREVARALCAHAPEAGKA